MTSDFSIVIGRDEIRREGDRTVCPVKARYCHFFLDGGSYILEGHTLSLGLAFWNREKNGIEDVWGELGGQKGGIWYGVANNLVFLKGLMAGIY